MGHVAALATAAAMLGGMRWFRAGGLVPLGRQGWGCHDLEPHWQQAPWCPPDGALSLTLQLFKPRAEVGQLRSSPFLSRSSWSHGLGRQEVCPTEAQCSGSSGQGGIPLPRDKKQRED